MKTEGIIKAINGKEVIIEIEDEVNYDKLRKYANGKRPKIMVELDDGRGCSMDQKSKTHALANDFGEFTGYFDSGMAVMKQLYAAETGVDPDFSFSAINMSAGARFIDWQINYMLINDVPFKTKIWDEIANDYRWQKIALKKRLCVVCGLTGAQVAHYQAIGSGMNRNHVDPTDYMYMSLCNKHHQEQHNIGIMSFCKKYIIKPIKLDATGIKEFRIVGTISK